MSCLKCISPGQETHPSRICISSLHDTLIEELETDVEESSQIWPTFDKAIKVTLLQSWEFLNLLDRDGGLTNAQEEIRIEGLRIFKLSPGAEAKYLPLLLENNVGPIPPYPRDSYDYGWKDGRQGVVE